MMAAKLGLFRGEISPTVAKLYLKDQNWFEKALKNADSDLFDLEGFDKFGYNDKGVDRAGLAAHDFKENLYYNFDEDLLDSGEELYLKTAKAYSFVESTGFFVVVPFSSIQYSCELSPDQLAHIWDIRPDGATLVD